MKRLLILIVLIFLLSPLVTADAELVLDGEGLLDESEIQELDRRLQKLSDEHGITAVIVTSSEFSESDAEEHAHSLWDNGGFGEDGILLFVSLETRDWALSVNGEATKLFRRSALNKIEDEVVPLLSEGEFYSAFTVFSDLCFEYAEKGVTLPIGRVLIPVVIGVGVGLITVGVMTSGLKSVKSKSHAGEYARFDTLDITRSYDRFLWRNVTRTRRQTQSGSGGSGGRVGRSGKF